MLTKTTCLRYNPTTLMPIFDSESCTIFSDAVTAPALDSFALDICLDTSGSGCENQTLANIDLPPPKKFVSRGATAQGKGPACMAHCIDHKYRGYYRRTMGEVISREESGLWLRGREGRNRAADSAAKVISVLQAENH